jgi:hypothetical protein
VRDERGSKFEISTLQLLKMRLLHGELLRFDSVTEMIAACRARLGQVDVRTAYIRGDLLLDVTLADGSHFESLIVHFEGERCYAVMLPWARSGR